MDTRMCLVPPPLRLTLNFSMVFKPLSKLFDRGDFKVLWLKLKLVAFYIIVESYSHGT